MKRHFPTLLLLLFLEAAPPAPAQSDMIIKQRARDLQNANNAQEGAPPAASPGTPPPAVPAAPPLSPAEQEIKRNVEKLGTDLAAIKSGAEVSADQKQTLQNDLDTLARGSVRPSAEALGKLIDDLFFRRTVRREHHPAQEQGKLAKALDVVVNSSMTTPSTKGANVRGGRGNPGLKIQRRG